MKSELIHLSDGACVCVSKWAEYILFASLLVLVCIIFAIMGYFYTYIDPVKIESQFADSDSEEDKKRKSLEMDRRDSAGSRKYFRERSGSKSNEMNNKETKM